jgi:hypothetical protein
MSLLQNALGDDKGVASSIQLFGPQIYPYLICGIASQVTMSRTARRWCFSPCSLGRPFGTRGARGCFATNPSVQRCFLAT